MNFIQLAEKHGIKPHGVVHVGAHEAQEVDQYDGINQLYIEPIPQIASKLQNRGLDVIAKAAADYTGKAKFFVTDFSQGSSMLVPLEHSVSEKILVDTDTLKNMIQEPSKYNCLVIDTQGTELHVLKGAELDDFDMIICETNTRKRYAGAPLHQEVAEYMDGQGFMIVDVLPHAIDGVINDCVFTRGLHE